jgi:Mrp family chromosome partitioning ATPase
MSLKLKKIKRRMLMVHIWPIGGGKGGSGKSFLTSSLGRVLAGLGKKTLLIDLDLGGANLHTLMPLRFYPQENTPFRKHRFGNPGT